MNKESIKKIIWERKFSIIIIIILLVNTYSLFSEKQDYKYRLLYQYQVIPDIELANSLTITKDGLYGEVRGFVKFDNIAGQPKDLRQYYIIKPLNKFNENARRFFSLEEIVKMQYLAPRSLGFSELVEVSETAKTITLEDESGNKFFIDKSTKEVSMKDASGDSMTLITSDAAFRNFVKEWLK